MYKKVFKFNLFILPCLTIILSTFFILTNKVNAAPVFDMPLPVGIPFIRDMQDDISVVVVSTVKQTYLDMLLNQYQNDVSDSYIIIVGYDEPNNQPMYHFTCFNLPSCYLSPFNASGTMTYLNNGQHYVDIDYDPVNQTFGQPYFYGGWVNNWNYTYTDLTTNGTGWVVDMAYDNLFDYYTNAPCWTKSEEAADYDVIRPEDIPDFTPDPYGPPSKPEWDPNKTIIENLFDIVVWIGDLILYGFKYVGNLIIGFLQNLIDNLKNFLKNIYDNLVSLIKPFFDKLIEILTNPLDILTGLLIPDPEDFVDVITSNDSFGFIGLFNAVRGSISGIFSQLHNLTPVYVFHVPSLTYHGQEIGNFDIDFTWFLPYKQYTDGIISAFLTIGWVYWLFVQAAGLLRGNTDPKDFKPSDVSRPN